MSSGVSSNSTSRYGPSISDTSMATDMFGRSPAFPFLESLLLQRSRSHCKFHYCKFASQHRCTPSCTILTSARLIPQAYITPLPYDDPAQRQVRTLLLLLVSYVRGSLQWPTHTFIPHILEMILCRALRYRVTSSDLNHPSHISLSRSLPKLTPYTCKTKPT